MVKSISLTVLAAVIAPIIVQGIKIAFVGDTGMEDEEFNGYGHRTMQMIDDENVDLVVDVGDFDYWGRCTETYIVEEALTIDSLSGESMEVPKDSSVKRVKWQDGRFGYLEGWEIGVQPSTEEETTATPKKLAIDGDLFQRHVVSHGTWEDIDGNLKKQSGERDCYGEPWDGSWEWNKFVRDYSFAFLGASGNAEVKEAPEYGSAEIWASHQTYMHELYMERIYNTNRGACHGYLDQTEPGSVDEYGERFSCYYNNNSGKEDFQFLFLGWWEGSNERTDNGSKKKRNATVDFLEREFSSERSQKVRWRFCIHHMTSAKLSAGGKNRDIMVLARITDVCRKHGAIIFSGHHHVYSRTKILQSVGSDQGDDPIPSDDSDAKKSNFTISEGLTMSITTGMGGYDGACNGNYWNATWMDKCIGRGSDHRGAVIAEFKESDTRIGIFKYMNSLKDGAVADEFQITSGLPGAKTRIPTNNPSPEPTRTLSDSPTSPEPSFRPTRKPSAKPESRPSPAPTPKTSPEPSFRPTRKPSAKPESRPSPAPTKKKELTGIEKEPVDGGCISVLDQLCSFGKFSDWNFSTFCKRVVEFDLVDSFSPDLGAKLTVFVPTDGAFEALETHEVFNFDVLTRRESVYVLLYHVVVTEDNAVGFDDLECGATIETANGESTRTKCSNDVKFQRGPKQMDDKLPKIVGPDIDGCTGVMHVIDNVILPNLDKMIS